MRQVLRVFERHRLWDEGVELIGSWCFDLYQRHCGVAPYPLRTQDIDFLLPYPYRGKNKVDLLHELEALGFERDFHSDGSVYLRSADFQIDFIVPERGAGMSKAPVIPSLGFRATPLRFMTMLLSNPLSVVEDGIHISIPDPAAFCLHKLLIAPRRPRIEKRLKDFEQALRVAPALSARRLRDVYLDLPKAWHKRIAQSLKQAGDDVPLLEDEAKQLSDTLQRFDHGDL